MLLEMKLHPLVMTQKIGDQIYIPWQLKEIPYKRQQERKEIGVRIGKGINDIVLFYWSRRMLCWISTFFTIVKFNLTSSNIPFISQNAAFVCFHLYFPCFFFFQIVLGKFWENTLIFCKIQQSPCQITI